MDVASTAGPQRVLGGAQEARYARQTMLPELGPAGQERLAGARVLIIGAGGLGSVTATYLAAAGVGTIGLVDDDVVDVSNLHRQVIHGERDLGRAKVDSAADRLAQINPHVRIVRHRERLEAGNARGLVATYDLVVDGADNFATRYVVGDACVLEGRPHVWGSILRFDGQASVWWPPHGPCYRCVFPAPPPAGSVLSCAEAGVLGSLCATIGAVCSTEAVKVLVGMGRPLVGRLLVHDALEQTYGELPLRPNPGCALCGPEATVREPGEGVLAACAPAPVAAGRRLATADLAALVEARAVTLIDVREPQEWATGMIAGAHAIRLGELAEADLPDGDLVAYCAGGVRSQRALAVLDGRGIAARDLEGGIAAWRAAGGPVVEPS
ncbi:MAG: molybdopterin-synthase adenylyltransferase MoeB [Dermatophilaceae bacterium]